MKQSGAMIQSLLKFASVVLAVLAIKARADTLQAFHRELSAEGQRVYFSVQPSNCTVAPDPNVSRVAVNFFVVRCPKGFDAASLEFPAIRDDGFVVVSLDPSKHDAGVEVTNLDVHSADVPRGSSIVQLKNLYLCPSIDGTDIGSCSQFQINVQFSAPVDPLIRDIHLLSGPPRTRVVHFDPHADTYPVELESNVPATFAVRGSPQDLIFVDSMPVSADQSMGFISASHIFEYRPRWDAGTVGNITVYSAFHDRSMSRNYTIMVETVPSSNPRLRQLSISPGRLEPTFSGHTFGYYARVPKNTESLTLELEALDDKNTQCTVNGETTIIGKGATHVAFRNLKNSRTIVIECIPEDQSESVRYTLGLVPQLGGSTLLADLDVVGGKFDRSFAPLLHGPYRVNLEMQSLPDQGWVAFIAHPNNPNALVRVLGRSFDSTTWMSPWFKVEKGTVRTFVIGVRTPTNPVEEKYTVIVDRRGRWFESARFTRAAADWVGWLSVLGSSDKAAGFIQNMHLMQFLSVSHRLNGKPEAYDSFSKGFTQWNLQSRAPWAAFSKGGRFEVNNGTLLSVERNNGAMAYSLVHPPTEAPDASIEIQEQATAVVSMLSAKFLTMSATGEVVPAVAVMDPWSRELALETAVRFLSEPKGSRRHLEVLTDRDQIDLIIRINAEYKKYASLNSYMTSIVVSTVVLMILGGGYAASVSYFVNRGVKSPDGRVRDMPRVLHPVKFWTFVFDILLISFSQAAFGILACPPEYKNLRYTILGFLSVSPNAMAWFAGFILLCFPIGYLCVIAWVLASIKPLIVFSKDLLRYHRSEFYVAKAEQNVVAWLPILSKLFAIEIRDVAPVFRADAAEMEADAGDGPAVSFPEDHRSGGPCRLHAPEFGLLENPIESRNRSHDEHYSMVTSEEEYRVRYHEASDELKVSLGGLRSSYTNDSDNAPLYDRYPDAKVGRKCLKIKNPYGFELDCQAMVTMKHLSNLWQMSELPHHFQFWIPRTNCQALDVDGLESLFAKAQRGNFFYYLIDRIVFIVIVGLVVIYAETSGWFTMLLIGGVSLALAACYTPSAIASGTSRWYDCMEQEVRRRAKEERFEEAEKVRQDRWPFSDGAIKDRVIALQQEKESMDACGHGGWFTRNPDCGFNRLSFFKHRYWFCLKEWITGAPGLEVVKCLIVACVGLGHMSHGMIAGGIATLLAMIVTCIGSFLVNYESLKGLMKQCQTFCHAMKRCSRMKSIWVYETFNDCGRIGDRFNHFFGTCGRRMKGINHASFDYPRASGEIVRDHHVDEVILVADEVGLQFRSVVKQSDVTNRLAERFGSRHHERYGLIKTMYKAGPLGTRRRNLHNSFPVRLPFRDFYLGKLSHPQGVAATIHIVNHGFRSRLSNPKAKDVFTAEDDSYLSLYRDPQFLPEWGVIRTKHQGHGYIVHYDREIHALLIRGPGLREGEEYKIRTDPNHDSNEETDQLSEEFSVADESLDDDMKRFIGEAVCTSSGTLYVPVPEGRAPNLHEIIEIQSPDGDRFSINPTDVKVLYDPVSHELTLRHRLFLENEDQMGYGVSWMIARRGVAIREKARCHETGVLQVALTSDGTPDLQTPILLEDLDGNSITIDPKDTDAHRVAIPTSLEPRGFDLVLSRLSAKFSAWKREIHGVDQGSDVIKETVPCTVIQCVNPVLGQYRIEPNFREAMKSLRAEIHVLEAQKSELGDVDRLAVSWQFVMSGAMFCAFWEKRGIKISPGEGLWINPLRDIHEPLLKSQFTKIDSFVPEFKALIERLFDQRVEKLETLLRDYSIWVRAYDDVGLYAAQLQKDMAELSGYSKESGLTAYVKKVQSCKQQYEALLSNFMYPFVVEERQISRKPNISAQLRQWQRQLAVWLRAEEDAPLNADGFISPRSISSAGSERGFEPASLERTVSEVMHALKENTNRSEDTSAGLYRSVLHYVTDSLNVRGPVTNWRPDPIRGHLALVRIWYPKPDRSGKPDFSRDPVWNPCCVKLSGNAIKILLPGKDDVDYSFTSPYYWSHVLGHSIQLDCLETLEVSRETTLPSGHTSNAMIKGMPGQLVCTLTSALPRVSDKQIRLVENGAPGNQILMKRDGGDDGSSPRPSDDEVFILSLGKRIPNHEASSYPQNEVRVTGVSAQVFPLTFRFGERFIGLWSAVIEAAQMNQPPLDIDPDFPPSEASDADRLLEPPIIVMPEPPEPDPSTPTPSKSSEPSTSKTPSVSSSSEKAVYEGDWQNYRYHGKGCLRDGDGNEVYSGEWIDGKRWGKGRCIFRDDKGIAWQYAGEFVDDDFCGKGQVTLVDENELTRIKASKSPEDRMRIVDFSGKFRGPGRGRRRGFTAPLAATKPAIHPAVLRQLFDKDQLEDRVIIDMRRTMSCFGDTDLLNKTLHDISNTVPHGSIGSSESQASYDAAMDEYFPHQTRWARSLDPNLGYESLLSRMSVGITHFADGSVYQGKLHNGLPHGYGRYMSADESVKFEGNWSRGLPHGYGVLATKESDGTESVYCGMFERGMRSGRGYQSSKDGDIYVDGLWNDDKIRESRKTFIEVTRTRTKDGPSLSQYTGPIHKAVPTGEGKLTWTDGVEYRGDFFHGKRHGQGVMKDANGRVVISSIWKDDVPHGRAARLVQPDGKVYTGDVYEGKREGMGELYHSEEGDPFFEGLWVNNVAHGRGTLRASDGVYDGEFKKGKRHGKGTFEYSEHPAENGKLRLYVGDWSNDLPHGVAKYRNELGVENTYKFNKGELDKASVNQYKSGMCGKAPVIGVSPNVTPAVIGPVENSFYGNSRHIVPDEFKMLLDSGVSTWRSISARPMSYVDPGPSQALPPPTCPRRKSSSSHGRSSTSSLVKVLRVTVKNGKDIPLAEGTLVFAKVIIGSVSKKTKPLKSKGSFNWNSQLNFPLKNESKLLVEVWEKGDDRVDRFIGNGDANQKLDAFLNGSETGSEPFDVPLARPAADRREVPAGTVTLQFHIIEAPLARGSSAADSRESSSDGNLLNSAMTVGPKHFANSPFKSSYVRILLQSAKDLPNMDSGRAMDPYVKVSVGTETKQTKVKKNAGSNPIFDEEFFFPYMDESRAIFEVYDKDTFSKDDFVGRGEVDFSADSYSGALPLYRTNKKTGSATAGTLIVSLDLVQ